jgi:hypothetical protein
MMRFVPLVVFVVVVLGGAAAALAPFYLDLFRRELSRADELERVAHGLGFAFSRIDPAHPSSLAFRFPFEVFSRGVEQTCENVMSGTIAGVELVAFDFLYVQAVDSDGTPDNDIRSTPVRHSCAVAMVAGHRPHVVVEPASAPRTGRADGEPVRLEWSDFNTRYRVVSPERSFAAALLDLDLMAWLVDDAPRLPLTWEVQRDHVLCRAPGLAPSQVALLVRATAEFARRVGRGADG